MKKTAPITFLGDRAQYSLGNSDYFASCGVLLCPVGGGRLRVAVAVHTIHGRMVKLGFPVISLYEWDGEQWLAKSGVIAKFTYNAAAHRCLFTCKGDPGKCYCVSASFFAEDSRGSDSLIAYSMTVTAR